MNSSGDSCGRGNESTVEGGKPAKARILKDLPRPVMWCLESRPVYVSPTEVSVKFPRSMFLSLLFWVASIDQTSAQNTKGTLSDHSAMLRCGLRPKNGLLREPVLLLGSIPPWFSDVKNFVTESVIFRIRSRGNRCGSRGGFRQVPGPDRSESLRRCLLASWKAVRHHARSATGLFSVASRTRNPT